jgi:hypothetical protein
VTEPFGALTAAVRRMVRRWRPRADALIWRITGLHVISASDPRDPRAATRIDDEGVWSSHAENQQWIDVVAQSMPRVRSYIRRVSKDDDEIVDLIADTRLLAWVGRAELLAAPAPADLILRYAREACRAWVALRRREVALLLSRVRRRSSWCEMVGLSQYMAD